MAVFALMAAAFVGLSVYAVLQFGLWWPILFDITGNWRMILAAVTLLPFLLFFTKLNWSRPLGWLAGCFNRLIELIDRAIER
ncbi:MAG: hypothetical protein CL566_07815 [Alphaproteobacteria bacterium]|nr:hypothetical protein [Alphaproteobacteria bacterium]|tara:strand:- start:1014 stop:1259 length:246 start_codon:yes stop_codon:yes gene_type:complete